jgi:hypothetical protein
MTQIIKWTGHNLELLKKLYPKYGYKEIQKHFPYASRRCINEAARRHGIKSLNPTHKKNSLKILLNDTNLTYYWIGFIMADGSIDTKQKRLRISLSITDIEHLKKFINFIDSKININIIETKSSYSTKSIIAKIEISDYTNIDLISKKYDMHNNKTYNPPNIQYLNDENKFLSFFIGFIDGDGCIGLQSKSKKPHFIRIHNEKSWLSVFKYFNFYFKRIGLSSTFKINTKGFAEFYLGQQKQLQYLKIKALELNLPYLHRKWDKIII